uniref:Uncharacterized protein n=1 Tax=Anopheles dirus TaxID=7168 RepID=A0A182N2F9_9DIPT
MSMLTEVADCSWKIFPLAFCLPAPYCKSRISFVGALRRCSGTPGIGPFQSSIDARHRLYASYTSRLFGARAR